MSFNKWRKCCKSGKAFNFIFFFGLLRLSLFHINFVCLIFQFLLLNSWKLHCTGVYGTQGIFLFLRTKRKILNYQQLKLRQLFSPIEELKCQRCKQYQSRILHPRSIGSVLPYAGLRWILCNYKDRSKKSRLGYCNQNFRRQTRSSSHKAYKMFRQSWLCRSWSSPFGAGSS